MVVEEVCTCVASRGMSEGTCTDSPTDESLGFKRFSIRTLPQHKQQTKSVFSVVREYACSHAPEEGHRMTEKTSWTEPRRLMIGVSIWGFTRGCTGYRKG